MLDYFHSILLPYLESTKQKLKLPKDYSALAIFDQFKEQITLKFQATLAANHVIAVRVHPNCTVWLQPLDLSINKAVKDSLRRR